MGGEVLHDPLIKETSYSGLDDQFPGTISSMSGVLYCGDNLDVLRQCVPEESVDLVYLDPPFNSQRTYNITYKGSQAQEEAFKDHWSWEEAAPQYARLLESSETPPKLRTLLRGLHDLLIEDDSDLLAYLAMMAPRLFLLHRVLKPTGSLYLHCDPTASHYLKMLLDGVFGHENYVNEVIWARTNARSTSGCWPRVHDVLLYYRRGKKAVFNKQTRPGDPDKIPHTLITGPDGLKYQTYELTAPGMTADGESGRPWRGFSPANMGRHWANVHAVMDEWDAAGLIHWAANNGFPRRRAAEPFDPASRRVMVGDVWTDIDRLNQTARERLGYPTQKPQELLERIIEASSNGGDLVLDPFCGCGTTIEACEKIGRRWIGIDIAKKAVELAEARFKKNEWPMPEVRWFPPDMDAARALCARKGGGQQFESWILRRLQAVKPKRDRGIDGEAHFKKDGKLTRVILSVKSGKLKPEYVRELRGTMEREHVAIGVLVTMQEPSKEMKLEAARAGYLSGGEIPRLQLLTVEEVFKGTGRIHAPGENVTVMPPPAVPERTPEHSQLQLPLDPPKASKKTTKVATGPAVAKSPSAHPGAATPAAKRRRA